MDIQNIIHTAIPSAFFYIGGHWLVVAMLAPMFWALVNIIDVYFVDVIYEKPVDGAVISGLFQILPWPFLIIVSGLMSPGLSYGSMLNYANNGVAATCCFSGFLYALSVFFYFKALFRHNDASLLQILWNFTVLAVPFFSFFLFGEILPASGYFGIALCFIGATVLSLDRGIRNKMSEKYMLTMAAAVALLSLSMVFQNGSYSVLSQTFGEKGFWIGYFFFSAGAFAAGALLALLSKRSPFGLIKKYYRVFMLLEGLYFLGNLFLQRALAAAPSASYVAAVIAFVPVFIIIYSLLILSYSALNPKDRGQVFKRIYNEQTASLKLKLIAAAIMALGIFLIS